jgi:hypothetical protein
MQPPNIPKLLIPPSQAAPFATSHNLKTIVVWIISLYVILTKPLLEILDAIFNLGFASSHALNPNFRKFKMSRIISRVLQLSLTFLLYQKVHAVVLMVHK